MDGPLDTEDWRENIQLLQASMGAVVPEDGDLSRIRSNRFQQPGFDPEVLATIGEMGWLSLLLKETSGGLGLGFREATALTEALGRGIVPEPFISAVLALRLMEGAGYGIDESYLTGSSLAVAAWQGDPNDLDADCGVVSGTHGLTGHKIAVDGGMGAAQFVLVVGSSIALLPRDTKGLTITPYQMEDGTFLTRLDLEEVEIELLLCPSVGPLLREAMLMQASYLLGLSERAFDITLDYLKVRTQFGVPIGSFQALQHRAGEIKIELELARAAVSAAAGALDRFGFTPASEMSILRAKRRTERLARLVAREAIQMHGAIGITDEADIGLFVRKAMVAAGQYGAEPSVRARFMTLRDSVAEQVSEVRLEASA